ncbi:hypothetical protein [Clostridium paraputrificum]|uniref:hypothetical protein n=1 Tax=Clostridium paraputrificum TaxID=29363 RepID=UPI00189F8374|nr:hypothetical protein [Clostridium paraputrificum]
MEGYHTHGTYNHTHQFFNTDTMFKTEYNSVWIGGKDMSYTHTTERTDCFQITKVDLLGVSKEDIISVSRIEGNFTIKYNLIIGEDDPKEKELNIYIPMNKVKEDTLKVNMLKNQLVIIFELKDEFTRKEIEIQ